MQTKLNVNCHHRTNMTYEKGIIGNQNLRSAMRQFKSKHTSESSGTTTHQGNSLEHRQNLKGDTNTKKPATPTQSMSQFQNPKPKAT